MSVDDTSSIFHLIGKDKKLEFFLLLLLGIHIGLYVIECTSTFTKNFQIQVRKIRKNNIEQFLYLISAIIVFVVGANLGFHAKGFSESFSELQLFFYIYIASLIIAFICNSLCSMTEPVIPLLDANGEVPESPFPNGIPYLSKERNKFFFDVAQYLLQITYKIQSLMLSYIGIGIVAAYTVSYPFGLLSKSLKEGPQV